MKKLILSESTVTAIGMKNVLDGLKSDFASSAKKLYDAWEQDDEGYSESYGSGGICDDIADAMVDIIHEKTPYTAFRHYDEHACHTSVYVYHCEEDNNILFFVDISPYVYEKGGGYTWKKINDVEFDESVVDVMDMSGYFDSFVDGDNCEVIGEAEYKGKQVELNKPFRTSGGNKKYAVYVKGGSGRVKMIRFGDPNLKAKINDPKAVKSFVARHKCKEKTDKTKAGYWACRLPRFKSLGFKNTSSKYW